MSFLGVSVRNEDVFIIQSGSNNMNDNIIELCIMIQAARIGSGKRITAVLPYFPYCKQSKRKGRTSITAKRKSFSTFYIEIYTNYVTCSCCKHVGSCWCRSHYCKLPWKQIMACFF